MGSTLHVSELDEKQFIKYLNEFLIDLKRRVQDGRKIEVFDPNFEYIAKQIKQWQKEMEEK